MNDKSAAHESMNQDSMKEEAVSEESVHQESVRNANAPGSQNSETTSPSTRKEEENKAGMEKELSDEEKFARRVAELEAEVKNLQEQQLRRVAEMENMRKRMQKERVQLFERSRIDAVESFLPVYDDLIRTLESMENADTESPYFEGVQMVVTKFNDVLTQTGLTRIDQTGVPFNVEEHDAMLRQKAPDESTESDTVLQVLESGYKMGDRTIRHAKVIVSE